MKYVKVIDGNVATYPYHPANLRQEYLNISFPANLSDTLLAEYNIFPVTPVAPPVVTLYQRVEEAAPVFTDGAWVQAWNVFPAFVPQSITPRQCRLLLHQQGMLAQAEAMVTASTDDVKITWEYALEFRRDDPLLQQFAANFQPPLTDEQLDHFFIAAAQL